jgi:ubiquinol-cytochrome c reductase cytochrome c subunit
MLTGGAYAALAPASADTNASAQAAVSKGRQLFLVGCSSCHGMNGEGIVAQGKNSEYGPPLIGVGAASVDFMVGTGRMPAARPGVQMPRKDTLYTDQEVSEIAAYVASLGPGPAIPDAASYDTSKATNEEIVKGGAFFRTNCTACHNFAASGGALPGGKAAPTLRGVDKKHMYEAMLTGPGQMPVFSDAVMKPQEKRDVIAFLKSIETSPSYGGSNLGSFGPVSEGLFAWVVGIGGLVGFAVWIAAHSTRSKKGTKA